MKRVSLSFLFVFLILFSISFTAFAEVTIDGSIKPTEFEDTNLEVQCDNGNSGNGLYVLVTYYKPLPGRSQIYLAFNAELNAEEVLSDGPFRFEIYIEDSPVIKIDANGRADFDSSHYYVEASNIIAFSGIRCESLIMFKGHMPDTPEIYVKVIDNNGVPSKMFKINTLMPEPTTETNTKAKEETTKKTSTTKPSFDFSLPFSLDDITLGTTRRSSQNTDETKKSNSSSQTEQRATQPNGSSEKSTRKQTSSKPQSSANSGTKHENQYSDSSATYQNNESVAQYDLANETSDNNIDAGKKRNMLVTISACAIAVTILGSAMLGIKIKGKK